MIYRNVVFNHALGIERSINPADGSPNEWQLIRIVPYNACESVAVLGKGVPGCAAAHDSGDKTGTAAQKAP